LMGEVSLPVESSTSKTLIIQVSVEPVEYSTASRRMLK
jgi:hypothetical protein